MANKQKTGLTYFPMEVNFFNDIKIRKLIKRMGGHSVTVYIDILCKIYKNGYFIFWDEELPFTISEDTKQEENFINEVIVACFDVGLLSQNMYQKNKVLTSKGIQDRYILICKQLKRSAIVSEFIINSSEETPIVPELIHNSSESIPQRKGKEKKEKEKKEKEKKIKVKENIDLTPSEIEKFISEFSEPGYLELINHLSNYKIEKDYKTKDDNLTIRRWVIDAVNEKKNKKNYETTTVNKQPTFKPGGTTKL